MSDTLFELNLKERILNPDRLVFTRWEETESTFVWKLENFASFKKSFRETSIQIELGNLKNHEDAKLILEIGYIMMDCKYYYGNLKEHYLTGLLKISSPTEIEKLVIRTYIVGECEEKFLDSVEVSAISSDSERNVFLFSVSDYGMDYNSYLQNDTLILAFFVTELIVQSKYA